MNKLDTFLEKHGLKLIIALLVLVYFKSCGVDSEVTKIKKDVRNLTVKIDSLNNDIDSKFESLPDNYDLKIEGLKVEKRMIQATNRKMLDVKRQNVIEKEIERLEKERK